MKGCVDPSNVPDAPRQAKSIEAHPALECAPDEEGVLQAIGDARCRGAAKRESAHENGQDGGHCQGGGAKDELELADPHLLEDESRRSREEKTEENERFH